MRHKTAGNIATFALSIPLILRTLRAERRAICQALAAALLLLGAASPLAADGSKRLAHSENLGGPGPGAMASWVECLLPFVEQTYLYTSNLDRKQILTHRVEAGGVLNQIAVTETCPELRQVITFPDVNPTIVIGACSGPGGGLIVFPFREGGQLAPPTLYSGDYFSVSGGGNSVYAANRSGSKVDRFRVVSDGSSNTLVFGESLAVNNAPHRFKCWQRYSSTHPTSTQFAFADGSVRCVAAGSLRNNLAMYAAPARRDDILVGDAARPLGLSVGQEDGLRQIADIPLPSMARELAVDPSGRRLYVIVVSTQPGVVEDQIRAYKVGPGDELTFVGSTPAGRFATDIEVTSDRVYVATVNNQNRDEIRTYRRRGMELILDTALATPGSPASFKQITVAPGAGNLTNVFVTEYQAGFLRSIEYTRDNQVACAPDAESLCLNGVEVQVDYLASGNFGYGQAAPLTSDTGSFSFFNRENVEVVPKVLDGRVINGSLWAFYGALSNVAYRLRLTDTRSGRVKEYENPAGQLASFADTNAFPAASVGLGVEAAASGAASEGEIAELTARTQEELYALLAAASPAQAPLETSACAAGSTKLCLSQNRFEVRVDWSVPSTGQSGSGIAVPVTGDTGYFTFFDAANVELIIKVLDARVFSGKFWLFYGALSNVEYTITVTDTETGQVKTYFNPSGTLASVADTSAF